MDLSFRILAARSFAGAVVLSGFFAKGAHAQDGFTTIDFCNSSNHELYIAQYDTYQGILAGYTVSGWHNVNDGGYCYRVIAGDREVRAFAFATFNESGLLTQVPLDFDLRGDRNFGRSTREICVPVQKKPGPFRVESGDQTGVAPPCREGHVPLEVSLNIRGGSIFQTFKFNIELADDAVGNLDLAYARIYEEKFGPLPDGAYEAVDVAAIAEQARRDRSEREAEVRRQARQREEERQSALENGDSDAFLRKCFADISAKTPSRAIQSADLCVCTLDEVTTAGDAKLHDRMVQYFWGVWQPMVMNPKGGTMNIKLGGCSAMVQYSASNIDKIQRWRSTLGVSNLIPIPASPKRIAEMDWKVRDQYLDAGELRIEEWMNCTEDQQVAEAC